MAEPITNDWADRQREQAVSWRTPARLRLATRPAQTVVTDAGFSIELENVRSYAPPTPEAPPETQLFLLTECT